MHAQIDQLQPWFKIRGTLPGLTSDLPGISEEQAIVAVVVQPGLKLPGKLTLYKARRYRGIRRTNPYNARFAGPRSSHAAFWASGKSDLVFTTAVCW